MVLVSGLTFCLSGFTGSNELGKDEGTWVALENIRAEETDLRLVYSINNRRLLLLQLRV